MTVLSDQQLTALVFAAPCLIAAMAWCLMGAIGYLLERINS